MAHVNGLSASVCQYSVVRLQLCWQRWTDSTEYVFMAPGHSGHRF